MASTRSATSFWALAHLRSLASAYRYGQILALFVVSQTKPQVSSSSSSKFPFLCIVQLRVKQQLARHLSGGLDARYWLAL